MDGFVTIGASVPWINKRPGEVLDYIVDFSDYLGSGEALSGISAVADTGIVIGSSPAPPSTPARYKSRWRMAAVKQSPQERRR